MPTPEQTINMVMEIGRISNHLEKCFSSELKTLQEKKQEQAVCERHGDAGLMCALERAEKNGTDGHSRSFISRLSVVRQLKIFGQSLLRYKENRPIETQQRFSAEYELLMGLSLVIFTLQAFLIENNLTGFRNEIESFEALQKKQFDLIRSENQLLSNQVETEKTRIADKKKISEELKQLNDQQNDVNNRHKKLLTESKGLIHIVDQIISDIKLPASVAINALRVVMPLQHREHEKKTLPSSNTADSKKLTPPSNPVGFLQTELTPAQKKKIQTLEKMSQISHHLMQGASELGKWVFYGAWWNTVNYFHEDRVKIFDVALSKYTGRQAQSDAKNQQRLLIVAASMMTEETINSLFDDLRGIISKWETIRGAWELKPGYNTALRRASVVFTILQQEQFESMLLENQELRKQHTALESDRLLNNEVHVLSGRLAEAKEALAKLETEYSALETTIGQIRALKEVIHSDASPDAIIAKLRRKRGLLFNQALLSQSGFLSKSNSQTAPISTMSKRNTQQVIRT